MRAMLKDALQRASGDGFVELRWHDKTFRSISVERGRLERSGVRRRGGVGVRVLVDPGASRPPARRPSTR